MTTAQLICVWCMDPTALSVSYWQFCLCTTRMTKTWHCHWHCTADSKEPFFLFILNWLHVGFTCVVLELTSENHDCIVQFKQMANQQYSHWSWSASCQRRRLSTWFCNQCDTCASKQDSHAQVLRNGPLAPTIPRPYLWGNPAWLTKCYKSRDKLAPLPFSLMSLVRQS